jgi:hypothetical protein
VQSAGCFSSPPPPFLQAASAYLGAAKEAVAKRFSLMFITLISNNKIVFKQWGLVRGWGSYCGRVLMTPANLSGSLPSFYNIRFAILLMTLWTVNKVSDEEFNIIVVCLCFRVTYCVHLQILEVSRQKTAFRLSCLTYSTNLNMEAARSFETSVNFCQTTRSHIPDGSTPRRHRGNFDPTHRNCMCK